jgi:hypothetical protein
MPTLKGMIVEGIPGGLVSIIRIQPEVSFLCPKSPSLPLPSGPSPNSPTAHPAPIYISPPPPVCGSGLVWPWLYQALHMPIIK